MTRISGQILFRRVLGIACILLLGATIVMAQAPAPQEQAPPPAQPFSPDQLDTLVAPIALYPDSLLSQVLVAATYPLEVVEAAQWLAQNRNLQGSQRVDAARQQNWDASIQALVVFPDVINRLNSDIRWTTDLGNAFLAQQADVMNAVQRMRAQARAAGKLSSNPQETVTTQTQGGQTVIEIQPADPQVVYVPVYNPEYVWGPPVWGYYPPLYYPAVGFGFGFGPGIYIGSFFGGLGWGGWGWGPNWFNCTVFQNGFFFHRYGFGFHDGFRGGLWAHNPEHRLGVPYSNSRVSGRFGGTGVGGGFGGGRFGGQRYATPREPSLGRTNPGGNFENRGNFGAAGGQSRFAAQQRSGAFGGTQANGAQAGGWHRFGEPQFGNNGGVQRTAPAARQNWNSATPSNRGNGQSNRFVGGASQPSYRPSPAYGSGAGYRQAPTPSYNGGSSYQRGPSNSGGGGGFRGSNGGGGGFRGGAGGFSGGGSRGGGGGGSHGGGGG